MANLLNIRENITEQDIEVIKSHFTEGRDNPRIIAFGIAYNAKKSYMADAYAITRDDKGFTRHERLAFRIQDEYIKNWFFDYQLTRVRCMSDSSGPARGDMKDCADSEAQALLDAEIERESQPKYYYCWRDNTCYAEYKEIDEETRKKYQSEIDDDLRTGFITDDLMVAMYYIND